MVNDQNRRAGIGLHFIIITKRNITSQKFRRQPMLQKHFPISALLLATSHYEIP